MPRGSADLAADQAEIRQAFHVYDNVLYFNTGAGKVLRGLKLASVR